MSIGSVVRSRWFRVLVALATMGIAGGVIWWRGPDWGTVWDAFSFVQWWWIVVAIVWFGTAGLYLLLKNKDIFQQLRGCTLLAGLVLFFISPQYGWYYLWLLPFLALTIEQITVSQVIATMSVAAGFVRYHLAQTLTIDLLVAPASIGFSLKQAPSVQWLWLLLVASAAWLSWV